MFVGPAPDALRSLGDKVAARELAVAAGFRLVPGGDDAAAIGFPLLVKAAAGGGGRGMRIVREPAELTDAMASAAREASSAFGDPSLYLERYLEGARHVEVQALGDGRGGAVHLGLRDCSLQRRHQKVLEEAPAPGVGADEAAELGAAACRLLRSVDYAGAATVELLRAADGTAYFLEVNARLQVEHPVTELVTGADLVALQLAIAGGEDLPAELAWQPRGHAVEARLVAEDADHGFLPTAGPLLRFDLPDGVRADAGYRAGQAVPTTFDGLLAKLIAHGADRTEALDRLAAALDATVVLGVRTNLPLLQALVADPDVRAGRLDTALLERVWRPAPDDGPSAAARRTARALQARAGRFRIGLATAPVLPAAIAPDGAVHVLEAGRDQRIASRHRARRGGDGRPTGGRRRGRRLVADAGPGAGGAVPGRRPCRGRRAARGARGDEDGAPGDGAVRGDRRRRALRGRRPDRGRGGARPAGGRRALTRPGDGPSPVRRRFPGGVAVPRNRPGPRHPRLRRVRGREPARRAGSRVAR